MTRLLLLRALCGLGALVLPVFAHGGQYRGPGTTMGPGSLDGPVTAGPTPGSMAAPTAPVGAIGPDLAQWNYWWEHNQWPFLALKAHIHATGVLTGSDGWFLGNGAKSAHDSLRPSEEQIRGEIVPALLATLAGAENNDLVTGCLVALAKIGADGTSADAQRIEDAFVRHLRSGTQEIRETAAVSLGILAHTRVVPTLANLLWDTDAGRKLVGANEVDYRTRSFAAYGLGLVGARTQSETDRRLVLSILRRALDADDTKARDLEVACLIAFGLVPLATSEAPAGTARALPEHSRCAQLDYVLAILQDGKREFLTRAHAPVTLARLLERMDGPRREEYRARIAADLVERLERDKDPAEVLQSCVLALGAIGTNGPAELDARIRNELTQVSRQVSEPQARAYAMIALAQVGARPGADPAHPGLEQAKDYLLDQTLNGRSALRPWAGLAAGLLCRSVLDAELPGSAAESLQRGLFMALKDERSHLPLGAYALGAGLARDTEAAEQLEELLADGADDELRGYAALGLALMDRQDSIEALRLVLAESKYRPELLRRSAMALGILGDKDVVPQLAAMLKEARSLASQASIASALGFIGDRRAVAPLLALLGDRLVTDRARAFAAVALGNVSDKEPLPWNTKIAIGLNYRAAVPTLTDQIAGTGILDIL